MFHLDRPMYLLGYLASQSRVYLIDKARRASPPRAAPRPGRPRGAPRALPASACTLNLALALARSAAPSGGVLARVCRGRGRASPAARAAGFAGRPGIRAACGSGGACLRARSFARPRRACSCGGSLPRAAPAAPGLPAPAVGQPARCPARAPRLRAPAAAQEFGVVGYTLLLSVIEYKTLVMRGDMDAAAEILPQIPQARARAAGGRRGPRTCSAARQAHTPCSPGSSCAANSRLTWGTPRTAIPGLRCVRARRALLPHSEAPGSAPSRSPGHAGVARRVRAGAARRGRARPTGGGGGADARSAGA